jgi:hypothetical protein
LAESQKHSQISIINRRIFKVTTFFINNLKNIVLKQPLPERLFDWQVLYIEAETRTATKSLSIAVTEDDVYRLVKGLIDREVNPPGVPASRPVGDPSDILDGRVSRRRLTEFVLDSLVIDEAK